MTQVFSYSEYQSDDVTKFIQSHPDLPEWFKDYLTGFSTTEQNRDDDLEDYLSQSIYVPSIGLSRAAPQSIPDAAGPVTMNWDGQDWASTSNITWSSTTNPSRATIQESGIVTVSSSILFASNTSCQVVIYANGTGGIEIAGSSSSLQRVSATGGYNASAGDFVEAYVVQVSGAPLNATGRLSCEFLGKSG